MTNETKWYLDQAHSTITFSVRHLMISKVHGKFRIFDASVTTEGKDFTTAQIDLWIDTNSIDTGDDKRDEHLKGEDFFDIANHKQISFISNTITLTNVDDIHELWGDLTMNGISKNIKLDLKFGGEASDPWGNEKAGFSITGKINRADWGLVWNSTLEFGGLLVSEDIFIDCEIQLGIETKKDGEMILEDANA
jgi:polyisoprenoid-binding protein YceI